MVAPMISGRETLDSIERALREASATADRLNAELDKASQDKARLVAERLEAFKSLAKFQADLALVDGVIDDADQLSGQVRTILQARQKTIAALKARESEAGAERERLLSRQKELDERIERLDDEIDQLAERARAQLADDPDYSARSKRRAELAEMVEKAAEKAERSRAEESEKGAPYRDDPVFMYLWRRQYGTSHYNASGVIRWLDGWAARLIGYQDARANFALLTAIPERLAAHVARLKETLQSESEALEAREAEKIRELAGSDLARQLAEAEHERERLNSELEALNAEIVETGAQANRYAEGLDPSFQAAVEKTVQFLEGQNLGALMTEARRTPQVDDDEIVGLIGKLSDEVAALDRLIKAKKSDLDAAFARKQELLRIAADFRRARYDRPDSVFEPGSGGDALLRLLLQGAITAAEYWMRTQRGQRWRGRSGDSYRHGSNFPFRGGRRGSSGPDFRTGGGF